MIFQHTNKLILAGKKSCTTRRRHPGDTLETCWLPGTLAPVLAVFENIGNHKPRARWVVGRTYAVQPERCHPAVCRIRITRIEAVDDPTQIPHEIAEAEGFATVQDYLDVWHKIHKKNPVVPCWRLFFERVKP